MESDFSIRNEIDSVSTGHDPSMHELLNTYKFPPANPSPANYQASYPAGGSNEAVLGNLIGQLQGSIQGLSNNNQRQRTTNLGGLQLNIDPDVLRWILLLGFLILITWLFMRSNNKRRNPLKRRLKRLEKQMKRLGLPKGKKVKKSLAIDDLDDDDDDDDD